MSVQTAKKLIAKILMLEAYWIPDHALTLKLQRQRKSGMTSYSLTDISKVSSPRDGIIEAAFRHEVWSQVVPGIQQVADPCLVICELDGETSVRRHLNRGLDESNREFYHGDKRVSIYKRTGQFSPGAPCEAPRFDLPTLYVSTQDGYEPGIEEIVRFIQGA